MPMWYAIISEDVEDSLALRQVHRPAHLARLEALVEEGRVLIAGPHPISDDPAGSPSFSGSLVVVDFDSLEEAKAWAEKDPYYLNGVYKTVKLKPFIQVLP